MNHETHSESKTKADMLYEALLQEVGTGALVPGMRLSERDLERRFAASRTPVRAAVARLVLEGLLERTTRGVQIRERPRKEILQVYDAWALNEAAAAEEAAAAASEQDLNKLDELLARHREQAPGHIRPNLHLEFHEALWEASHNPVLAGLLQSLNTRLLQVATSTLAQPKRWEVAVDEHARIVEALHAGRGKDAAHLAHTHILSAREARLQMWRDEQHSSLNRPGAQRGS